MKRSTPHRRIVAMRDNDVSSVERAYQEGLELGRAGRFFDAHEAFETAWRACADADDAVVVAHPAESAHRVRECEPRDDERGAEPERVGNEEDDPARDRAGARGKHEDRREHRPDARRRTDREGSAEERVRAAPP